jgi:flagellar M-ring protein FliF
LQGSTVGGSNSGAGRREAATRFEVDKTTTVTKNAVGSVRRLSAAVVVNHRSATDAKGKVSTVPLSDKEIEQLTALVQQGIGFNAERGDVVKVVNAPFRADPAAAADDTPVWKQPWVLDLVKSAAAPLALALVALVITLKLVRPAVMAVVTPPAPAAGSQLNEVVADSADALGGPAPVPALSAPRDMSHLNAVRALAKENPAAVASVVRSWVNDGVPKTGAGAAAKRT